MCSFLVEPRTWCDRHRDEELRSVSPLERNSPRRNCAQPLHCLRPSLRRPEHLQPPGRVEQQVHPRLRHILVAGHAWQVAHGRVERDSGCSRPRRIAGFWTTVDHKMLWLQRGRVAAGLTGLCGYAARPATFRSTSVESPRRRWMRCLVQGRHCAVTEELSLHRATTPTV